MTVRELLSRTDSRELSEWLAYWALESPDGWMPFELAETTNRQTQSPDEQKAMLRRAFGGWKRKKTK